MSEAGAFEILDETTAYAGYRVYLKAYNGHIWSEKLASDPIMIIGFTNSSATAETKVPTIEPKFEKDLPKKAVQIKFKATE